MIRREMVDLKVNDDDDDDHLRSSFSFLIGHQTLLTLDLFQCSVGPLRPYNLMIVIAI